MKCAVFKAPFEFAIEDRPLPALDDDQVLVKIMASGICGSDLAPYQGQDIVRRQPGIVMGHEAAGVVSAVAASVKAWQPGDRVAINPQIFCGHCAYCLSGLRNLCANMLLIGSSKRQFLDGAMCDFLAISAKQLIRLPDAVSYDAGAMLDPIGNAFHLARRAGIGLGQTVVVIGCGTIGLVAIQVARLCGAARIIAVNRSSERLIKAAELGADLCLRSGGQTDVVPAILDATGGLGADVVIDAAGSGQTYQAAVRACRKRGTVVALGYTDPIIPFNMTELIFKEVQLIGVTGFADEQQMVLDYLAQGKLRLDPIITHTFPLSKIKAGFDSLLDPASGAVKVMIHPNEESR